MRILREAALSEWNLDPAELVAAEIDLLELVRAGRPVWQRTAACRGMGSDVFFLVRGTPAVAARAICAGCPVAVECADFARVTASVGVWAGSTDDERRRPAAA